MIVCAFLVESAGLGLLGLGPGRHPHCTRCAWKAGLFSGPEGYAQNPRGRIGLRFVREYYVHRPFLCTTLRRNVKAPPIWGHDSSQCHGTQESAKSLMLSGITVTFRTLFLRFDVPAPLGVASGPASRRPWEPSFFSSIMCRYPSRFEVCGGTREDNLTRPWQRSHLSRSSTQRRSGSVRVAHPDPSRKDHRTHAMSIAAEFSGRVHSRPSRAG